MSVPGGRGYEIGCSQHEAGNTPLVRQRGAAVEKKIDTCATVVVPARNEASVLPSCLEGLLGQEYPGRLRVIVAANDCLDDTAEAAQSFSKLFTERGHRLDVLELPGGGKPGALNAADELAGPGVRIYLDADVVLSKN